MFSSPFENDTKIEIPESVQVIIVADLFQKDYVGGAELTTQALIDSCPYKIMTIYSKDVNMELLEAGKDKFWIFGNFAQLQPSLIPSIIANLAYAILEYDYKFCVYRSIEKHFHETGNECDCHNEMHGKMMSAFFHGAKSLWWMSEQQEERYLSRFKFLENNERSILSSVFNDSFFTQVKELRKKYKDHNREGWIVLGSNSWIKGASDAITYCKDNNLQYEVVWELPYEIVLDKLAKAEGFVYLPRGGDTCPRMVIEAKLLGCKLHVNNNVQHCEEIWFDTKDDFDTLAYLYAARERFWNAITHTMNYCPTLSGYTTLFNGNEGGYPWKQCITSMLGFCEEVIVLDAGSDDGTWEELQAMALENERLKISQHLIDWNDKRFAYQSDGAQKARARALCTSDYCWQMDADEIVKPHDFVKIRNLLKTFPMIGDILDLPVVEYWGSVNKIRVDVNPWKWRLSRNKPHITHGIPRELRKFDESNNLYAAYGTDSCDYINDETFERIPHIMFYSTEIHQLRIQAASGDASALKKYQEWYQRVIDSLPTVYHHSWLDIPQKIRNYKKYWSKFWCSMYNISQEDTPENNMFFDKKWEDVTDTEINEIGRRLSDEMGGWIFHDKIKWEMKTPSITLDIKD